MESEPSTMAAPEDHRTTFVGLSADIKTQVISHIMRPSDMVSLCLVSKELHELTVPQLYKTVELKIAGEGDKKLPAMIDPANIGLKHIRNLRLKLATKDMVQADFTVRMLLQFLPKDILHEVRWHPWERFSTDNLKLLYQKQRNMKRVEAIGLDRKFCDDVKKELNIDQAFSQVSRLGLYPDGRETLEFCHELIKRMKTIEKLIIHSDFDETSPQIPPTELNDAPTEPGLVTRTIFRHMMPFSKCTPYALSHLKLEHMHLRYASETYCKVIRLRQLKKLYVYRCPGAEALLAELSKSDHLPEKLETFEFKHKDDHREFESLNSLEGFLTLVSGIRRLTIDLSHTRALPAASSITRHSKTLISLNVHTSDGSLSSSDEEEHVYDNESITKICNSCSLLEEMSLAFPRQSATESPKDDYDVFISSITEKLADLVTLNVTSWPTTDRSSDGIGRKMYEHLLQNIAQNIFEKHIQASKAPVETPSTVASPPPVDSTNQSGQAQAPVAAEGASAPAPPAPQVQTKRPSRLNIVAFGTSENMYEREDGGKCIIYAKGSQINPVDQSQSVLAVKTSWRARWFWETRSRVLEFPLSRHVGPPVDEER